MQTYISLLRGINVSGQRLIKMADLQLTYAKLGFESVETYIQSGNVVFRSRETDTFRLQSVISRQILKDFGFEVPVLVLTAKKLEKILTENPFKAGGAKDLSAVYITFLHARPDQHYREDIITKKQEYEEIVFTESVVYLYCPKGYGKTKLNNAFLESKLRVEATTRNLKTSEELLRMTERLV
jgi:uncharacterized protein (DUF1697 family)